MQRVLSISVMIAFNLVALFAQTTNREAPGAPGHDAHWPSAAKDGFGTANTIRSKVWFTLADGVMTEVYYPTLDVPNVQMLQLVMVGPEGKVETESDDTDHSIEVLDRAQSLSFKQENQAKSGLYTITKFYVTDRERSSLYIDVNFRWHEKLPCRCSLYV